MVEYKGNSNSAYLNLILRNPIYKEHIKDHEYCGNCLNCRNEYNLFQSKDSFDSDFSALLKNSNINSPEKLSFQTRFIQESTCACGNYLSSHPQATFKLRLQQQPINIKFSNILQEALINPFTDSCIQKSCKKNVLSGRTLIKNKLTNLIFSIDWESKTLKSLLNFILNLDTSLDLNPLFGFNSQVYLQGMVLAGVHQSIYVEMNPCRIFLDMENNQTIYIEYLNFFMLQYSLYPTILVYSENNCGIEEYSEKTKMFETVLEKYLGFLTGKNEICEEVCFYCWNISHYACQDIVSRSYWVCGCGWSNGKNILFCQMCSYPQRTCENEDPKSCVLCLEHLNSTYCFKCFFTANCSTCQKPIVKTQSVACLQCNQWVEGYFCKSCDKSIHEIPVSCQSCFMSDNDRQKYCIHNGGQNCFQCYFGFKCGICKRPKLSFEFKYCWKCKNKLIDGLCVNCKYYPATNSLVCVDCVSSIRTCRVRHVITEQSENQCSECQKASSGFCKTCSDNHKECINRKFCAECGLDLEFTLKACIFCESLTEQHICEPHSVCIFCYPQLSICSCGHKLLSKQERCLKCFKLRIPNRNLPKTVENPDKSGKKCLNCEFFNNVNSNFCENCNSTFEPPYSIKYTCPICKSYCSSKYCELCYKTQNCSSCKKDILIGQGLYCAICMSKTCNGVCKTCNSIVPLSKIICLPCSLLTWLCFCGRINEESQIKCLKCNSNRTISCTLCNSSSVFPDESWRVPEKHLKPIPFDQYYCKNCSQILKKCDCGFIILPTESICKNCDRIFD